MQIVKPSEANLSLCCARNCLKDLSPGGCYCCCTPYMRKCLLTVCVVWGIVWWIYLLGAAAAAHPARSGVYWPHSLQFSETLSVFSVIRKHRENWEKIHIKSVEYDMYTIWWKKQNLCLVPSTRKRGKSDWDNRRVYVRAHINMSVNTRRYRVYTRSKPTSEHSCHSQMRRSEIHVLWRQVMCWRRVIFRSKCLGYLFQCLNGLFFNRPKMTQVWIFLKKRKWNEFASMFSLHWRRWNFPCISQDDIYLQFHSKLIVRNMCALQIKQEDLEWVGNEY